MPTHHMNEYLVIKKGTQATSWGLIHSRNMNEAEHECTTHIDEGSTHPGWYEIRLKGHLDDRWADWFDRLIIMREDNGETRLSRAVVDQAAFLA
jgi:hypothetical protein